MKIGIIVFSISAALGVFLALKQEAKQPAGNYQLKQAQVGNIVNQPVVKIPVTPTSKPQNIVKQLRFDVTIETSGFNPAQLNIKTGNTVTWKNNDTQDHSVTKTDEIGPDSPPMSKGQGFLYTFTKPGTYRYHDSLNPKMTGTVTVE